jgi:hypothetical protein
MAVKAANFLVRVEKNRLQSLDVVRRHLRQVARSEFDLDLTDIPTDPHGLRVTLVLRERDFRRTLEMLRRTVARVLPGASVEQLGDLREHVGPVHGAADAVDTRHVNTFLAEAGSEVVPDGPLDTATNYDVMLHIGRYDNRSLLLPGLARFPAEFLPDHGLWLRVVLATRETTTPAECDLYLPREGESFTCTCPSGGDHRADCTHEPWLRMPLPVADHPGRFHYEILIYLGIALVYSVHLDVPIGRGTKLPTATPRFRLTTDFADLEDRLGGHDASLFVAEGIQKVVVNRLQGGVVTFHLSDNAADRAAREARRELFRIHYPKDGLNAYDRTGSRGQTGFEADLRGLAFVGARLFNAVFGGQDERWAFGELLRHEARGRGWPPLMQVPQALDDRQPMLWSIVYDLPLGETPDEYILCRSVREYGPEFHSAAEVPVTCPYAAEHPPFDVVCLFGFWGLGAVIEQLPFKSRYLKAERINYDPLTIQLTVGPEIDDRLVDGHLLDLRGLPDMCVTDEHRRPNKKQLQEAWQMANMDLAYVLAHCKYRQDEGDNAVDRLLWFKDYTVGPLDVGNWTRKRWRQRQPLVLLNTCHSVEHSSKTLTNFVDSFVSEGGASGVVGTETTLAPEVAVLAARELITALNMGATVGQAMRTMRWALVRRGNLMGLTYTPYSLANLRLRSEEE